MIRIVLHKESWRRDNGAVVPSRTEIRQFEDAEVAANWLIEDSYFAEPYTWKVVWERVNP